MSALALGEIPPAVLAEKDLEKRSELALKAADEHITAALKDPADIKALTQYLSDVEELSRLTYSSLQDTGKRASKNPKYFKRAELKLRSMMRRLDTLEQEVAAEDRPAVARLRTTMSEIRDHILHDIMSKK
jgi:tetrahydromethanopterin S-methyltransferase subunit G